MDWTVIIVLQVIFQPSLSDLFTVEAEQPEYKSEFGGDVVMRCRFQPVPPDTLTGLSIYWRWISPSHSRVLYVMDNGKEHLSDQDMDFHDRVQLNTEKLQKGWAELKVSRLRINDSGTYQCLVKTGKGTDYKQTTLSVTAPYKAVTQHIQEAAERDEVLLTCQSEGYPQSSVVWQAGHPQNLKPNTTSVLTPDHLFQVTSQIRVNSLDKNNYTCSFKNGGYTATFHIPDDIPLAKNVKNDGLIVALSIIVILVVIVAVVFAYQRRKVGFSAHGTGNSMVDGVDRSVSDAAGPQRRNGNEYKKITSFSEDSMEENLGAFLKTHYSDPSFSMEVEHGWDLPHRLQNNEGQTVLLQDLLPEAGEMLFLEGLPGSGKTTIAQILISSWAKGPKDDLSYRFDLSMLRFLLYVDCSTAKADLFQEIKSQLSLGENVPTADELRTLLTRSTNALLLLDGYREGNQFFDESLKKFLRERGQCRVLVMACPEHCPTFKVTFGTGRLLKLQIPPVKY